MSAADILSLSFCPVPFSMETFNSSEQVRAWMLAMSNYPPPPPPEPQHFNTRYPTYGLEQPVFPKIEPGTSPDQNAGPHSIQALSSELHHRALHEEQQRQHLHHAAAQLQQHQATSIGQPNINQRAAQRAASEHAKSNRLRKACDSCSIRKVKVNLPFGTASRLRCVSPVPHTNGIAV